MKPGWIFRNRGATAEEAVLKTFAAIAEVFPQHFVRAVVRLEEYDQYGVPRDYPFWECIIELPVEDPL